MAGRGRRMNVTLSVVLYRGGEPFALISYLSLHLSPYYLSLASPQATKLSLVGCVAGLLEALKHKPKTKTKTKTPAFSLSSSSNSVVVHKCKLNRW